MTQEQITSKESEAIREIRNAIMQSGRVPSMRELMSALGYKSPRSASLIIDNLIKKGFLRKKEDGGLQFMQNLEEDTMRAQTVDVPLIGTVACGMPILAQENIQGRISVSVKIARPPHKYFFLKAKGDSMDLKGIYDGDLVLIKQHADAKDGDIVVALIDDAATIKEFRRAGNTVVLSPHSKNKKHKPIVLTDDFEVQGVVVTVIPKG
jgi:repressor LexA